MHRLSQCPCRILKPFRFCQLVEQAVHAVGIQHGMLRRNADPGLPVQSLLRSRSNVCDPGIILFQQRAHHPIGNVPVQPSVRQNGSSQAAAEGFSQCGPYQLGISCSGSVGVSFRLRVAQQGQKVSSDAFQQFRGNVFFVHGHLSSQCGCRSDPANFPCRSSRGSRC